MAPSCSPPSPQQELFFPVGHCMGVAVGGYLLQGGYGWNGRVHGPACMSVEAIDVVTAEGELVRADAEQHSELLWAARGSGPGFFAVVTGFHVRLYPRPKVAANALYTFPIDVLEDLFRWVARIGPTVPRSIELMLLVHRDEQGELEIAMTAPVLAADEQRARADLSLLESCPLLAEAKVAVPYVPVELRGPVRRQRRHLSRRPPLGGGQHVDARPGREAAARPAADSGHAARRRPPTCCG